MDKNRLYTFLSYIAANKKLFWRSIENNLQKNKELLEEIGAPMINWAAAYLGDDYTRILADGYVAFVIDVSKSQMEYEKRGYYRDKTYDEIFSMVYNNPYHMSLYHWGVYVITFAWAHHIRVYKFYKDNFISLLNQKGGLLLDLGSGSGVWGLLLLNLCPNWKVQGVDISKKSVELANKMAELNGFGARAEYSANDALLYSPSEKIDACISCFLLEHLENPKKLLMSMAHNLEAGSFAFLTVALTASEIDHIKEFKHESEIVIMAEEAGFRVLATYSASPESYPSDYKFLPRSMALVLQKRRNNIW